MIDTIRGSEDFNEDDWICPSCGGITDLQGEICGDCDVWDDEDDEFEDDDLDYCPDCGDFTGNGDGSMCDLCLDDEQFDDMLWDDDEEEW